MPPVTLGDGYYSREQNRPNPCPDRSYRLAREPKIASHPFSFAGNIQAFGEHQPLRLPYLCVISLWFFFVSTFPPVSEEQPILFIFPYELLNSFTSSLFEFLTPYGSSYFLFWNKWYYFKPFTQSVLNTKRHFDFLRWKKCWVHLLTSSNSELAVSLSAIFFFFFWNLCSVPK